MDKAEVYGRDFINVRWKGSEDMFNRVFYDWDQVLVDAAKEGFPLVAEHLRSANDNNRVIEVEVFTNNIAAARLLLMLGTRQLEIGKSNCMLKYDFKEGRPT